MTVMTARHGLDWLWESDRITAAHNQQQEHAVGHGTARCVPPNAIPPEKKLDFMKRGGVIR